MRREESVEQALEAYRRRRAERTTEIVNRSWRLGRLASTENPLVWAFRDYVLFPRFGEKFAKQTEEMMAYEV